MSADNWGVCPKCREKSVKEKEQLQEEAAQAYGKVSREEWLDLTRKADEYSVENLEESLKEYYEIGVDQNGEFMASYSGSCTACDFSFRFKHEEKVCLKSKGKK